MKTRTKFAAALTAAILSLLLAGSALAAPIDGIAESADDLRDELMSGPGASKKIVLAADIDYREPIFLIQNDYTFDLNSHILNIIDAPLLAIESILRIQGEGELNIVVNSFFTPVGALALYSDITVTNVTSGNIGVIVQDGRITVNGEISAPVYAFVGNDEKAQEDGVIGTGPDAGYLLYKEGESIVRVKCIIPEETHTVSYHPNWALCEMPVDMNRYYRGDKVTLASGEGLSNPGYEFAGWELADGTLVTEPFIMGESDVTLFARWVKD